ncbi:MAG: histidinol dehydrogenase [Christensenellales bacterium]|jgi:histidinol dehydrogenase
MIRIFDHVTPEKLLQREEPLLRQVETAVAEILDAVRRQGDKALLDYSEKFDQVRPASLRVSPESMEAAWARMPKELREAMEIAKSNILDFHKCQLRQGFADIQSGFVRGQRILPLDSVGIYVPGGTARYPSSILMNALPAKVAGVGRLVMVTPPDRSGVLPDVVLGAAWLADVEEVYTVGGAHAIAGMAYGTETLPRVDKIVGPGNIYVATAKRMVSGRVGIDMEAGPSEIIVVADGKSNPAWIAADMLSQAEHDKLASAVLLTDSRALAEAVSVEIERQLPLLPRREIARESINTRGMIAVTDSIDRAIETANVLAPEHLELCVEEPFALLGKVRHAGSVFLGRYTPEALGDYLAGPNHVLPTAGTARFASPLSVDDFVKRSSYICFSPEALGEVGEQAVVFARAEGLEAHARSVTIRLEDRV